MSDEETPPTKVLCKYTNTIFSIYTLCGTLSWHKSRRSPPATRVLCWCIMGGTHMHNINMEEDPPRPGWRTLMNSLMSSTFHLVASYLRHDPPYTKPPKRMYLLPPLRPIPPCFGPAQPSLTLPLPFSLWRNQFYFDLLISLPPIFVQPVSYSLEVL